MRKYFLLPRLFAGEVGCARHNCNVFDGLLTKSNLEPCLHHLGTHGNSSSGSALVSPIQIFPGIHFYLGVISKLSHNSLAKLASALFFSNKNDEESLLSFSIQSQMNSPEL